MTELFGHFDLSFSSQCGFIFILLLCDLLSDVRQLLGLVGKTFDNFYGVLQVILSFVMLHALYSFVPFIHEFI